MGLIGKVKLLWSLRSGWNEVEKGFEMRNLTKVILGSIAIVTALYNYPPINAWINSFWASHVHLASIAFAIGAAWLTLHKPTNRQKLLDLLEAAGLSSDALAKVAAVLSAALLAVLMPVCALAQTPAPTPEPTPSPFNWSTFSLTASPIALPGGKTTAAGILAGGTLGVTQNLSIRQSNFIAPASDWSGYFGGVQYAIPALSNMLNNLSPKLNGRLFQPYVTASAGVGRIGDRNHYSFLAGGGVNYDPIGNGKFIVNLFEIQYAKLPGLANNTVIVSAGPQLHF